MLAYADVTPPAGTDTTGGAARTPAAAAGSSRTHVIQANDRLWLLAEKYYGQGNGKHWQIIATANPGISPNSLPVGRTIKIPPLPVEATRSTGAPGAAPGTISTAGSDGKKTYVIAKGDSFWKIAARSDIYGKGIHWKHIAAANPNVDPGKMREGSKLIIPPLPATATTVGGSSSSVGVSVPAPVARTGETVYVVQRGDAGMWGIAKANYGDGKYFPAIADRNPGVNPSRLREGQKIVLPSLEKAKAFISGSGGGRTSPVPRIPGTIGPRPIPAPRPVATDGEPDFS